MQQNINTLNWMSKNTSDGKLRNSINGRVEFKLQVGEIYAFKTKDDPNYYKTITSNLRVLLHKATYCSWQLQLLVSVLPIEAVFERICDFHLTVSVSNCRKS